MTFIALAAARSVPVFVVDFQADLSILVERLRKRAMQAGVSGRLRLRYHSRSAAAAGSSQ